MTHRPHEPRSIPLATQTIELKRVRTAAEDLLGELLDARLGSERRLADLGRPDAIKLMTGRSALDRAVDSTRRMIHQLDALTRDA